MTFQNRELGVLEAFDRAVDGSAFDAEDESLLTGFAASAAMAVATAQTMAEARLRDSIEIAERERARWRRNGRPPDATNLIDHGESQEDRGRVA